jgi:hypothetical protein
MRKTIQDEEAKKPINGFQTIIIFFVAIINIKNEVRPTGQALLDCTAAAS